MSMSLCSLAVLRYGMRGERNVTRRRAYLSAPGARFDWVQSFAGGSSRRRSQRNDTL